MQNYLPADSLKIVSLWIVHFDFDLKIKRSRLTKLGDYRHPFKDKPHEITINENLNPYSFLITLVHEIAHLKAWNKHRGKIPPHGKEWKDEFKSLLLPLIRIKVFPDEIFECLERYAVSPKASSCADTALVKVLKKYDSCSEYDHLENIPEKSIFTLRNGRTFIKGEKIKKRFKCTEIISKKHYLVSPVAEVIQTTFF